MLEMNQEFLIKAFEMQNKQNYEESVKSLEKINKSFHILGSMADQIPYTPFIIRESREVLSQAHLEKLQDKYPCKLNVHYEMEKSHNKSNGKKKQKKTKWAPEEQELFLEGLEKYGPKSKNIL